MPIVDGLDEGAFSSTQQARSTNRSLHRATADTHQGNTTVDSIRCQIEINPQKYIEDDDELNNSRSKTDDKRAFLPALTKKNYF